MNKEIDDYDYYERQEEAKKIFKIAIDYLKLSSSNLEKSKALFEEYLKWNNSNFDGDGMAYEVIGDAYKKYSINNEAFKSEAEHYYKKAFDLCLNNKDPMYKYYLSRYYLEGIGTSISKEKSFEVFESWYHEYNFSGKYQKAQKIYKYIASFYSPDGYLRKYNIHKVNDFDGVKIWLNRILEIIPNHREAKESLSGIEHYLKYPKMLERMRRVEKRREFEKKIFEEIKSHLLKKPPDFNSANKIFYENDSSLSEIEKLEKLGDIYKKAADRKNSILHKEAEKFYKSAFDLCKKNASEHRMYLARFYIEGKGTEKSFVKGQYEYILHFNTISNEHSKAYVAEKIAETYSEKKYGLVDFKEAKIWLLKANSLGKVYDFERKIKLLEQNKSFFQNYIYAETKQKSLNSKTSDQKEILKDLNVKLENKELNIFDRTLFDLVSKSHSKDIAESYLKNLNNKKKLAQIVYEIVNLSIKKANLPKIHLMNFKQQNGTGLFLCLFTAAITNIYIKLNPGYKIKNDDLFFLAAVLFSFPIPEDFGRFVKSSAVLTDKFLSDPKGIGMFKIIEYKLIIFLNGGKNPNNMGKKIPMPLSFEPVPELSFEKFCEEYLTALIAMTVVDNPTNANLDIIKNESIESKTKPDDFSKGFSGEELEYINGILMEYFEQHKGWLGGYKPATYHNLGMHLTTRSLEEARKGNKLASSIGLKIPPMGIPQEIFGYYNNLYSIEQKGFDPLGIDTIIRIKK